MLGMLFVALQSDLRCHNLHVSACLDPASEDRMVSATKREKVQMDTVISCGNGVSFFCGFHFCFWLVYIAG